VSSKFKKLSAIAAVVAVLTLVSCRKGAQQQGAKEFGSAAPETSLRIPTMEGTNVSIDQYKGKVVLVNFWATWCAPCRTEIPLLIEFNEKYGPKGLVILGIAMDDEGNKVVQPYVQNQHSDVNGHSETMSYQILLGSSKIAEKFGGILGMPTSMLYSRDGKKVKTIVGLLDRDDLAKALEGQL